MKKRTISFILLICIFAIHFLGCDGNESNNRVKIGATLVLSGNSAKWGEMAKNGIELILEEKNSDPNLKNNYKVIYEDTRGEPSKAISGFKKLIDVDKVQIVLGDMLSSTTLAMSPMANDSKVVLIGISCSAPAVTNAGPYVYRVWPSDLYEGTALANWAIDQKIEKVGVIYLKNDYGEGLKDAFKKRFALLGGTVLQEEYFTDSDKNYRNSIQKVLNGVDAVYVVGYYENTALIVKQIREVNQTVRILGTSSSEHESLLQIAGKAAEGFIYPLSSDWDLEKLNVNQKMFRDKFFQQYGVEPDWAAVHGADAAIVAINALERANMGPDIKKYIDKEHNFDGITGLLTFDENGDVINKPIVIKTVRNNTFTDFKVIR